MQNTNPPLIALKIMVSQQKKKIVTGARPLALKTAVLTTPLPLTAQALALAGGCQLMIRMNEMPEKMILLEIAQFCCLKKKILLHTGHLCAVCRLVFQRPLGIGRLASPHRVPLAPFSVSVRVRGGPPAANLRVASLVGN